MAKTILYSGNTPMPDMQIFNDYGWIAIQVDVLCDKIINVIRAWGCESTNVMIKSDLSFITVSLFPGTDKAVLLYFDVE